MCQFNEGINYYFGRVIQKEKIIPFDAAEMNDI